MAIHPVHDPHERRALLLAENAHNALPVTVGLMTQRHPLVTLFRVVAGVEGDRHVAFYTVICRVVLSGWGFVEALDFEWGEDAVVDAGFVDEADKIYRTASKSSVVGGNIDFVISCPCVGVYPLSYINSIQVCLYDSRPRSCTFMNQHGVMPLVMVSTAERSSYSSLRRTSHAKTERIALKVIIYTPPT